MNEVLKTHSKTYNEKLKIYVDMDGVLTDMVPAALEWYGVDDYTDDMWPEEAGYDIVKAYHILTRKNYIKENYFWRGLTQDFWATIPKTPFCDELIDFLLSNYSKVYVCTSCTFDPESAAGKLEWIQKFLPECLHRNYIITPHKYLLAKSDSVLIDDCDSHTEDFEKYGGHNSILVPRPWNKNKENHLNPFEYILKALG
jgi:5'(3')-deoxyribonucleotidase